MACHHWRIAGLSRGVIVCCSALLLSCGQSRTLQQQRKETNELDMPVVVGEPPVATIHVALYGRSATKFRPPGQIVIVVAVWEDGSIIWSEDLTEGGPPYRQSRIDPAQVKETLSALSQRRALGDSSATTPYLAYIGFGADWIEIRVAYRACRLRMASWHELFEQNPGLVGTHDGIEALDGRDRRAVLAAQPESYRRFRRAWTDIRASLLSLIPDESTLAGNLTFEIRREKERAGMRGGKGVR